MGRLHLGTILGTTIEIDFSFIILIAFFVLLGAQGPGGIQFALLWAPVIFISVLIHELAHAATIALFGFGSSEVVLGGFGGVTMNRRNAKAWQDMLISAAGPLSSFALGILCTVLMLRVAYFQRDPFFVNLIPLLAYANFLWGKFNLLPVAPLDGNGIVRNFLRLFLRERYAFMISIWISFIAGALFIVWMLLSHDWFMALMMLWFLRLTYDQWVFFRKTNRTDD